MNWLRWRHRAEYLAFRMIVCLINALSTRTIVRLSTGLAFVFCRILPRKLTRYEIAKQHIRQAFGESVTAAEIDRIIFGMWTHLFRMVTEIVQLPRKLRLYNCADVIEFRNGDRLVQALCTGRPVIVLSGHFGNWEMATAVQGLYGFPAGIVARDLDNSYLHEWFCRWRQATGHRLISKKGGAGEMVTFMDHRGCLGLLGDQDAGSRGLFVPFFGKQASTFKSIALLAAQYRALICVCYARRLDDDFQNNRWVKYEVGCEEVIDSDDYDDADAIRLITERYTAALERAVRRAPQQYFWVHRRWKSIPGQRRKRRKAAA
jgi:KDO2-lipid IV(A) lauroyltransferase